MFNTQWKTCVCFRGQITSTHFFKRKLRNVAGSSLSFVNIFCFLLLFMTVKWIYLGSGQAPSAVGWVFFIRRESLRSSWVFKKATSSISIYRQLCRTLSWPLSSMKTSTRWAERSGWLIGFQHVKHTLSKAIQRSLNTSAVERVCKCSGLGEAVFILSLSSPFEEGTFKAKPQANYWGSWWSECCGAM